MSYTDKAMLFSTFLLLPNQTKLRELNQNKVLDFIRRSKQISVHNIVSYRWLRQLKGGLSSPQ